MLYTLILTFSYFYLAHCSGGNESRDLRRSPQKNQESPKCGTAEMNYYPCTSKSVANKLFSSCCELYLPPECHFMCSYETDQAKAKEMLVAMTRSECSFKYLSSILYCASQNRDNRQCCADLDLNASQLMVGSRCLRFCDPSGVSIGKITKEDVTCMYNWNVMMYCHHSGIREM
ncbi:DB module domain-containing protein [Ditylenchus destructor]|nr:DB module domain-containing protein [Ditylenchus destructor]